ncbi:autotransporter domain-containing protein [Bradyrhizobium sp. 2TAF24]|uniref:autotransporter domain-containing protein n=1 Tax=Bradyrhizobium sp. 2TAF24 TaxID=3233011 RepID=UPI003F92807D
MLTLGHVAQARAQSGPFVYVPNNSSNTISVIDTTTNSRGSINAGSLFPAAVAVRGDQSLVYVANNISNTVSVIDTATNAVTATIPVGNPWEVAVSADGNHVYVTNIRSNTVSVISTATNTVTATIRVGNSPEGIAVSANGTAYVTNQNDNTISVINTATNTVTATIPVGSSPGQVAASPDGSHVYVTNLGGNTVSVINTATNMVTATAPVGTIPSAVAVSADGRHVYVTNRDDNTVSVIDVATNTVTATIAVGTIPLGLAMSADGSHVYVTNNGSNTVSVIDTATNTVTATLAVGNGPQSPGVCGNGNALLAAGLTFKANTAGALGCTGVGGPVFTGGTLRFAGTNIVSALPITLTAAGGTFDTAGNHAALSGTISGPGGLAKIGAGTLTLSGAGTYGGPTLVNAGTLQAGSAGVFSPFSAYAVATGAILDLNGFNQNIGSLAGSGRVTLGGATLTTGNDGTSTRFSGTISGTGGLTKIGAGTLTLAGANTYTGATFVGAGTLQAGIAGAFSPNGSYAVASGAALDLNGFDQIIGGLTGTGSVINSGAVVPTLTIASGGIFAPGNGTPGTSMMVTGNLALQSGAIYKVQLNPAAASLVNVTGAATLGGSALAAVYANGSYVARQYTILSAGSVSGTFGSIVETNLPSNFHTTLSYDATHAYLNLVLNFVPPSGGGLSGNQQKVGDAIITSFNNNGGISQVYSGLTSAGLTQASGETAVGSQQTTFQAMGQFIGLLTDPFSTVRETGASATSAYADSASGGAARDAYAMFTKAPLAQTFEPRWSVWAAGFGGLQTTDGNTAQGSNSATSRLFGTAAGAEYAFSPQTLAGFSLAGGGTSFSVAGGGSGRSDLFQAGAYVRHNNGPSYISAALAYGWQDVTTDRIVTLGSVDRLRAEFNVNAWSGRVEGGYRLIAPWAGGIGITPYAVGQFTTFDRPAYAEAVVSGSNAFALAYAARSVTGARSELGLRTDKSFAMQDGVLTLRGRAAWAHDFNPDRAVAATFQALPGASFVVSGARPAADSALATAAAEMRWPNGWSTAATFEGEFSDVTKSYAGKGVVRYAW